MSQLVAMLFDTMAYCVMWGLLIPQWEI